MEFKVLDTAESKILQELKELLQSLKAQIESVELTIDSMEASQIYTIDKNGLLPIGFSNEILRLSSDLGMLRR
jgi:hypothetical protein